MRAAQFEALLEAAEDGVDCEGLTVAHGADGYAFAVPGVDRSGLSEAEVHELATEHAVYVTNWYYWDRVVDTADPAREAFLRWIEGAPPDVDGEDGGHGVEREHDHAGHEARHDGGDDHHDEDPDHHDGGDDHDGEDSDHHDEDPDHHDGEAHHHESGTAHPSERYGPELRHLPDRYVALEEGVVAAWGELRIRTTVDEDGLRTYEVCHEDDADADVATLDHHEDPLDARELVKTDPKGRYRPLKTAPSLQTGWAFVDLDGHDLVRCVDYVYPATVANWHRERRGTLDVDHWSATARRQTGIYDVLEELDREAVEWIAEACCVDSQCLKRREWQFDEDEALEADPGDGPFPCREPCSLVVAAARKWTILEQEREKTYQLELTTSEFNQLSEIVDAVADGRIDEIREADVYEGANRYRARYLRAKRFDEDGALPATELEE